MFKLIQDALAAHATTDTAQDMRETAYRLLTRQFIYRSDHGQTEHYDRIVRHQEHFQATAHLVGLRLLVQQGEELVGVTHDLEGVRPFVRVDDAIMLLLLRHLYEERAHSVSLNDQRCAEVTSLDIEMELQNMVGRDLAARKGQFRTLMAPLEARGLVKVGEDTNEGEAIEVLIRPAIKYVIDDNYIARLRTYCRTAAMNAVEPPPPNDYTAATDLDAISASLPTADEDEVLDVNLAAAIQGE